MLQLDDVAAIQEFLKRKVAELALEPEFAGHDAGFGPPFALDEDGSPAVRVAVADASPEVDIWQGLRSPAAVGMHPLGFREIWDYYAANSVRSVRRDGSPNYLAMPEPFEQARERHQRAVIVSALLPIAPGVFEAYADKIERGDADTYDRYPRANSDVEKLISRAVARLALALVAEGRAVVCMNGAGTKKVADFALPKSRTGKYHGPCNDPFPRPSVAALTGLTQFGVARIPIRDEVGPDGRVRRFMGHCSSVVAFDERPDRADGGGVLHLDPSWLGKARRLADYTVTDEDTLKERYCAYGRLDGGLDGVASSACGKCLTVCPSGAVVNSSPRPDGSYTEAILKQKHRFHDGFLDFDFGNCCRERGNKKALYSEYACARCVAVCAAKGLSGLGAR